MVKIDAGDAGYLPSVSGEGRLGAVPSADGETELRVWAPSVRSLAVDLAAGRHELERDGEYWAARIPARAGDEYLLVVDDAETFPDPCSRAQPHGVRGPSRVVDGFQIRDWDGLSLDDLVLYELHVGTFTDEGTFDAAIPRLRGLRELGVPAIELMPV